MRALSRYLMTISFLALLSAGVASAQETVLLRLAPPAGQLSHYKTDISVWMISGLIPTEVDPQTPTVRQEIHTTSLVTEVVGDVRHITVTIDSTSFDASGIPGAAGAMPDMSGIVQHMQVDSRGQVLESAVVDSTVPAALRGMMGQVEQITTSASTSLDLPQEPIVPGYTWEIEDESPTESPAGRIITRSTRRFSLERVEVRDGVRHAILSMEGTISQQTDQDDEIPALMQMSLTGSLNAEIDLDLDAGRIFSMTNRVSMDGELVFGGQSNQMFTSTVVEMKLVE